MVIPNLPNGLRLEHLTENTPPALCNAARTFCLHMVQEVYGFAYRPDWHADLDSLQNMATSPYAPENHGAFFAVLNDQNEVVGTTGIRSLATRPDIINAFAARYPAPEKVASRWRLYVNEADRGPILAQALMTVMQQQEAAMGYEKTYFHCSAKAKVLRRYWQRNGFTCFAEDADTAHYDGPIYHRTKQN